jgi:hypothetical protein
MQIPQLNSLSTSSSVSDSIEGSRLIPVVSQNSKRTKFARAFCDLFTMKNNVKSGQGKKKECIEDEKQHFDIYGKSVVRKTRDNVEFNEDARRYVPL